MAIKLDSGAGILKISGSLDIDAANSLREALLHAFLNHPEVAVDLSEVESCDTAALQVLLAARCNAAALGKVFRVHAPSELVAETAAALGFTLEGASHAA